MINQIINILFPVFALVGVGYLVGRYIKPDFRPINRINIEVFTPALVFSSLVSMPLDSNQGPLLLAAIVAVLIPALLMIPVCRWTSLSFKTWAPPHMFRNSGNLAIPLFTYTFGEIALSSAVLLFVVSACLHISLGVMLLSHGNPFKQIVKMPIFLAASLALFLNVSNVGAWALYTKPRLYLGKRPYRDAFISGGTNVSFKVGRFKDWCVVYRAVTGNWCCRFCTYLLVNSPSNDAIANDGALHNAAASRHELPICGKAEYRTHESGVNGTIWQLFQHSYATSSA